MLIKRDHSHTNNFTVFIVLLLQTVSTFSFSQLTSYNKLCYSNNPKNSKYRRANNSIVILNNAKFKIDYDEDDERNNNYESYDNMKVSTPLSEKEFGYNTPSSTITSFGSDAVPENQRPANEYSDLISSPLFGWANQERGDNGLAIRLGVLYVLSFALVCWPISGATFVQDGYGLHKVLSSHIGALGLDFVLLLRLYSGWSYVGTRLQSKEVEYEETGWYDGNVEEKTESEKARDLLLYRQSVKPVEDRLKTFTTVAGVVWLSSLLALNVLFQIKPLFNEYDPNMLEKLVYDEKMADIAASQSNGRPTYCESRYYRAVANGGQGCN